MQAIARLTRAAVAEAVRQDDEILRGIEQLTGPKQNVRERRIQKAAAGAARSMSGEDGVLSDTGAVGLERADGAVMDLQFREYFAAAKFEVVDDIVIFNRRRIVAWRLIRLRARGKREDVAS